MTFLFPIAFLVAVAIFGFIATCFRERLCVLGLPPPIYVPLFSLALLFPVQFVMPVCTKVLEAIALAGLSSWLTAQFAGLGYKTRRLVDAKFCELPPLQQATAVFGYVCGYIYGLLFGRID